VKHGLLYYCSGSTLPAPTAGSIHTAYMAQALAREVSELTVFAKGDGGADLGAYYGLDHVPRFELVPFRSRAGIFGYLARLWRAPKPTIVFSRYVYPLMLFALRGVPVVYEVHAPAEGYKRWAERWLIRRSQLVALVVITRALQNHYRGLYPQLQATALVLADAANDPGEPAAPRTAGRLTVGYVGSWYPGRGVEIIVRLAELLPEFDFVAAGGTAQVLRERGLSPPDNLRCAGYVAPAETAAILRDTDVLLAPYQRQIRVAGGKGDTAAWSSPMKFFEYMAHGKAIVCSDLAVFHEVFTHAENCLFVEPDDVSQWVDALRALDHDRDMMARLGRAARAQFLAEHTWDQRAQRLLDVIWPEEA